MSLLVRAIILALSLLSLISVAEAGRPLFRSVLSNGVSNKIVPTGIQSPKGWKSVPELNREALAIEQWVPQGAHCPEGATSKVSLYAIDQGLKSPIQLIQRLLPQAASIEVRENEGPFSVIRGTSPMRDGLRAMTVAYSIDSKKVTPLMGYVDGVKLVFIAESTSQPAAKVEDNLRSLLRHRYPEKLTKQNSMNGEPFILMGKNWNKALLSKWSLKDAPSLSYLSQAYAVFSQANAYVPRGQEQLLLAAELGNTQAKLDLIRLSEQKFLTISVEARKLATWQKELEAKGHPEIKYFLYEKSLAKVVPTEAASQNTSVGKKITSEEAGIRALAKCGYPDAERFVVKKQVQSFNSRDRYLGRMTIAKMLRQPALEERSPIYLMSLPRLGSHNDLQTLKELAVLKTACPNEDDPDESLFVKPADIEVLNVDQYQKQSARLESSTKAVLPELQQAIKIDRLANAGSQQSLKEALHLACNWEGEQSDKKSLIIELALRRDGLMKWKPFQACMLIDEPKAAEACRSVNIERAKINLDTKFNTALVQNGFSYAEAPDVVSASTELRKQAQNFANELISWDERKDPSIANLRELDEIRYSIEYEFISFLQAALSSLTDQKIYRQIGDVLTGRRLLIESTGDEGEGKVLVRQPTTKKFMRSELTKLEKNLSQFLKEVDETDSVDLSRDYKTSFKKAYAAWNEYRHNYFSFAKKVRSKAPSLETDTLAADVWFHIEGVYYLRQTVNRELARAVTIRGVASQGTAPTEAGPSDEIDEN